MTDWPSIVSDLRESGLTHAGIAAAIGGYSASGIGDLSTGRTKSPRYAAAAELLELHAERCAKHPRRKKKSG